MSSIGPSTIGSVENAMLARIDAGVKSGALGYSYMSMGSWPKNFDSFLESEIARFPACWAAFGGSHAMERQGTGRFRAHSTFALVVAAENKRNEAARRQGGSPKEVGSYQMAQDALVLLGGSSLGLDIDVLRPTTLLPVETGDIPKLRQVSIYAVTFETALYFDVAGPVDPFVTFHANWDPWPYGHVDPDNLPDDGPAIGTDHVILAQE